MCFLYSPEHTIRLRLFDLLFFRRSRGGPALMLSEVRSFSPFGSSCQPRRRRMGRRPPLVGVSKVIIPAFRGARLDGRCFHWSCQPARRDPKGFDQWTMVAGSRSEEHTSELQSLMRISYAVF